MEPFGQRICADAVKDELANLDKVDTAASKIAFDATSSIIKAPKDANGYQTGELYTTELKSGVDARVVKLDWTGSGVTFYVSTDGSTWSQLQKDQPFTLGMPGRSLYLKAVLAADAGSVLDRYLLQINPNGFNLFTGKMLTEETGLVYFGARWYDPEIGRFITVDPAEDGENWYGYCDNDPINYIDSNGNFKNGLQTLELVRGIAEESLMIAGFAVVIAAATPYIAPAMPVLVPVFAAAAIGSAIHDIPYLIKNFNYIFFGHPSDSQVRYYGHALARTIASVIFVAKMSSSTISSKTSALESPNRYSHYTDRTSAENIIKSEIIKPSKWETNVFVMQGKASPLIARRAGATKTEVRVTFDGKSNETIPDPGTDARGARMFANSGQISLKGRNPKLEIPSFWQRFLFRLFSGQKKY